MVMSGQGGRAGNNQFMWLRATPGQTRMLEGSLGKEKKIHGRMASRIFRRRCLERGGKTWRSNRREQRSA
jgi:hypothetical protein